MAAAQFEPGATLAHDFRVVRPLDEVCTVFEHVGNALAAAHAAGIVHRDIKAREHDEVHAVALFRRACARRDHGGCDNLATMLDDGRGVAADPARAAPLYTLPCSFGDAAASPR
jgi:TPR repeat protein